MRPEDKAVWEKVVELLEDNREYIEANERPEYLDLYDKGIADANALLEQPAVPLTDDQYETLVGDIHEWDRAADKTAMRIIKMCRQEMQRQVKKYDAVLAKLREKNGGAV